LEADDEDNNGSNDNLKEPELQQQTVRPLSQLVDKQLQGFSKYVLKEPVTFEEPTDSNFFLGIIRTPAAIITRLIANLFSNNKENYKTKVKDPNQASKTATINSTLKVKSL